MSYTFDKQSTDRIARTVRRVEAMPAAGGGTHKRRHPRAAGAAALANPRLLFSLPIDHNEIPSGYTPGTFVSATVGFAPGVFGFQSQPELDAVLSHYGLAYNETNERYEAIRPTRLIYISSGVWDASTDIDSFSNPNATVIIWRMRLVVYDQNDVQKDVGDDTLDFSYEIWDNTVTFTDATLISRSSSAIGYIELDTDDYLEWEFLMTTSLADGTWQWGMETKHLFLLQEF